MIPYFRPFAEAEEGHAMIAPYPSPMGVYQGQQRIGEIVDHGKGCVMAYLVTESGRKVLIGRRSDRKAAMVAVSEAHRAGPPPPLGAA